jgi:hypothetical protein
MYNIMYSSRITLARASICCKFVVKWRDIAGLFYYRGKVFYIEINFDNLYLKY